MLDKKLVSHHNHEVIRTFICTYIIIGNIKLGPCLQTQTVT